MVESSLDAVLKPLSSTQLLEVAQGILVHCWVHHLDSNGPGLQRLPILEPFCCTTEPLGRTERFSSDSVDLAMLYVSSFFGTPPLPLLFFLVHFSPKTRGRSVRMLFRMLMEVRQ